ncbi:MAG: histidinol dehydrogenase, partial [Boseongicola sp. SB0667_bin_21]|nr:histidinol dehydrogenase [Boseongicola sp. SB0667_bin_21]
MAQFLNTADSEFESRFRTLLSLKREDAPDVNRAVAGIIADVRARGDEALVELTAKFDHLNLNPDEFTVSEEEIETAVSGIGSHELEA